MLSNREVAVLLRRVSAVHQIFDTDSFRAKAYDNAANGIENLTVPLSQLYEQKQLNSIPGVGEKIAKYLSQLFKTGNSAHFNRVLKMVPAGMFPLLDVRGFGPQLAYKFAKTLHLNSSKTSIKTLIRLIEKKKLPPLDCVGDLLTVKLLTSLKASLHKNTRLLQDQAFAYSADFINYLRSCSQIVKIEPLGSLRRHLDTIGDLDLGLCAYDPLKAMEQALKYPQIAKVLLHGRTQARVKLANGYNVDLKIATPSEWGSLLVHYTGSRLHNIALRKLALSKGLSLSEHGIKNLKTKKVYQAETEESYYRHLGLQFIPPELRQGNQEIELAKTGQIPNLVTLDQIKGDLHLHTNFEYQSSHDRGESSLAEYLERGMQLGYQYLGFSDHNPKATLSKSENTKVIRRRTKYLVTQYQEYENKVKTKLPKVLIGLEVDIKKDGTLPIPDEVYDELDYVIVSIHSSFDLSSVENTKRIFKAISHPKVLLLGHPTGRMLNYRDGIQADWDEIFKYCASKNIYLEINSSPSRLDLPKDLIIQAKTYGAKFIVNSDSHHVDNLSGLEYGVWNARRGWCDQTDIVNTKSWSDLRRLLK